MDDSIWRVELHVKREHGAPIVVEVCYTVGHVMMASDDGIVAGAAMIMEARGLRDRVTRIAPEYTVSCNDLRRAECIHAHVRITISRPEGLGIPQARRYLETVQAAVALQEKIAEGLAEDE